MKKGKRVAIIMDKQHASQVYEALTDPDSSPDLDIVTTCFFDDVASGLQSIGYTAYDLILIDSSPNPGKSLPSQLERCTRQLYTKKGEPAGNPYQSLVVGLVGYIRRSLPKQEGEEETISGNDYASVLVVETGKQDSLFGKSVRRNGASDYLLLDELAKEGGRAKIQASFATGPYALVSHKEAMYDEFD